MQCLLFKLCNFYFSAIPLGQIRKDNSLMRALKDSVQLFEAICHAMTFCQTHINTHNTGVCGLQAAHCITQDPGDARTSITSFRPRFTQLENVDKKEEICSDIWRNTAVLYLFPIFTQKNDNKSQRLRNGCNKHGVLICKLEIGPSPWKPPAQT